MQYREALAWLYGRQRFGVKLGLETVEGLLGKMGRPQDSFQAFHVTGTNGKGSASAFLAQCLRSAGHHVGLYTSPHLVHFRERIQVDGEPVSEREVAEAAERLRPLVESMEIGSVHPTFFECATALAFDLFRRRRVPWAVLEVGMGGRLDATNVCRPAATVITNIGLDHTQHLGTSYQAIAREKAGILKPGIPLVTGARGVALDVIAQESTKKQSPVRVVRAPDPVDETWEGTRFTATYLGQKLPFETTLLGTHQAHNAALALATLEAAAAQVPISPAAAQEGIRATRWPGRLELASRDPLTLLDGAHNAAAMEAIAGFLDRHAPHRSVAAVVAILRDKNAAKMLAALCPRISRLILTKAPSARTFEPHELQHALPADAPAVELEPEPGEAFRRALAHGTEQVRLITGSLFLVGEARAQLLRLPRDPTVPSPLLQ